MVCKNESSLYGRHVISFKLSNILGYTERIYKDFARVKQSEMDFCS